MALLIEESWLPATISHPAAGKPMSDEDFAAFCSEHPDLSFEMTADGEIVIMPPPSTLTGIRCGEINGQLWYWNRGAGRGACVEATGGFVLPSGARRSPDAAWISGRRMAGLAPRQVRGFWHVCPNFVVELKSDHDRLRAVRTKILEWIENGVELGWLIDPDRRAVEVFRADGTVEILVGVDHIAGEGPVGGFVLDLVPFGCRPPSAATCPMRIGKTSHWACEQLGEIITALALPLLAPECCAPECCAPECWTRNPEQRAVTLSCPAP